MQTYQCTLRFYYLFRLHLYIQYFLVIVHGNGRLDMDK